MKRSLRSAIQDYSPKQRNCERTPGISAQRSALEATLEKWAEAGWGNLVAAIRRILDGATHLRRDNPTLGAPASSPA